MKILFVIPELGYADQISVAYLSAVAKKLGHKTYFLSLDNLHRFMDCSYVWHYSLWEITTAIKPDIVAYSTTIAGFKQIVDFNNQMKKQWNHISILGGAYATFAPETFEESGMDYYCVGEGDYVFADFFLHVEKELAVEYVGNLIHKGGKNYLSPLIKNLDSLPFPDRDLTIANSFLKDTPKKTFYTSRGCFYNCSYCANNYYNDLYKGQKIARRFSVDRVIEEIKYVKSKYRCDFVKFGDDLFALKADSWLVEFSIKYQREINIPFNCYLRVDSVQSDLLMLLKYAGCYSVHLSIDSTSEYIRNDIFKRKVKKDNKELIRRLNLINNFGIKTWVNFMLAAPYSTTKNDLDTIRFSKKAKVTYTAYSTTDPIKGTDLYKLCIKDNFITNDYSGDMSNCSERSPLNCFTIKDKDIRYNIYLLGSLISKLPLCMQWIGILIIRYIKPNKFFRKLRDIWYKHNIENKIFKLN